MDDALHAFAVDVGDPHARRERARILLADGVTVQDVEALGRHFELTCRDETEAVKAMCACLADPESRAARLLDLHEQEHAAQDVAVLARMAYCRVVTDRRAAAEIAKEMDLPVDRVMALVEQGRAIRKQDDDMAAMTFAAVANRKRR